MISKLEYEKKIVQNFCNNLIEMKVNTILLRKMTTFTEIPYEKFEKIFRICFSNSKDMNDRKLNEYKNKIILFICAKNACHGRLTTLPLDMINLISLTASMLYKFMQGPITVFDCINNFLRPSRHYDGFNLGLLSNIRYKLLYDIQGISTERKMREINLYCDFLERKITSEVYTDTLKEWGLVQ